jgi:hypothetical protein
VCGGRTYPGRNDTDSHWVVGLRAVKQAGPSDSRCPSNLRWSRKGGALPAETDRPILLRRIASVPASRKVSESGEDPTPPHPTRPNDNKRKHKASSRRQNTNQFPRHPLPRSSLFAAPATWITGRPPARPPANYCTKLPPLAS